MMIEEFTIGCCGDTMDYYERRAYLQNRTYMNEQPIDPRFTQLRPLLIEEPTRLEEELRTEPCLYEMIKNYYGQFLNSFTPQEVEKLTTDYIKEWLRLEKDFNNG